MMRGPTVLVVREARGSVVVARVSLSVVVVVAIPIARRRRIVVV
jgi:hypothetical protein